MALRERPNLEPSSTEKFLYLHEITELKNDIIPILTLSIPNTNYLAYVCTSLSDYYNYEARLKYSTSKFHTWTPLYDLFKCKFPNFVEFKKKTTDAKASH